MASKAARGSLAASIPREGGGLGDNLNTKRKATLASAVTVTNLAIDTLKTDGAVWFGLLG